MKNIYDIETQRPITKSPKLPKYTTFEYASGTVKLRPSLGENLTAERALYLLKRAEAEVVELLKKIR